MNVAFVGLDKPGWKVGGVVVLVRLIYVFIFSSKVSQRHTCKKREIVEIYLRNFFWIFRKILG